MSSRELVILQAIEARLKGPALGPVEYPTGLVVDRCRLLGIKPDKMPHVSVYPLEDSTSRKGAVSETPLLVKIVIWVKGSANQPLDEDIDPIWLWVHQQLITEESLGGLTLGIQPVGKVWGFAVQQAPLGDLDLHYLVPHRHNPADPTRPA